MRYYSINISDPSTGKVLKTYNSQLASGQVNMSALDILIDAQTTLYSLAENAASVQIWGPDFADIQNASNWVGKTIDVWGGMQTGLPLANQKQAGLLLHGNIYQCFSNWIGNAFTLDFVVLGDNGEINEPVNIVGFWAKGSKISDAIANAISPSLPMLNLNINIKNEIIALQDEPIFAADLNQFATWVNLRSNSLVKQKNYAGINMSLAGNTINFFDSPNPVSDKDSTPKNIKIEFIDMIGQPAWVAPGTIQLYCVMRGDIAINDLLTLPPSPIVTSSSSLSQVNSINKNKSMFQGVYRVSKLRHIGKFRSKNALDWLTTIDCNLYAG